MTSAKEEFQRANTMVKPPLPLEPVLTGVRKTLLQQQGEVTVKDPATHSSRQVLFLGKIVPFDSVGVCET